MRLDLAGQKAVTLCAGASASGKSSFAVKYLLNARLSREFIFDPEGEFSMRFKQRPAQTAFDLEAQRQGRRIIFDPNTLYPGQHSLALKFFCAWAFAISSLTPGQKILLIDEVWKYCSPAAIPAELATVVQTGRKRGLGLLVCTQRPNRINAAILGEVSEAVCFRMQTPLALETMEKNFGLVPAEMAALPPMHFVSVNTITGGRLAGELVR